MAAGATSSCLPPASAERFATAASPASTTSKHFFNPNLSVTQYLTITFVIISNVNYSL